MHILITNDDGYSATGIKILAQDAGEGSNFHALEQTVASVTPMQIDLTRHHGIQPLQNWLDAL